MTRPTDPAAELAMVLCGLAAGCAFVLFGKALELVLVALGIS